MLDSVERTGWLIVELLALALAVMVVLFGIAGFLMHGIVPVLFFVAAIAVSGVIAWELHTPFGYRPLD